jgi:hypothetical protein
MLPANEEQPASEFYDQMCKEVYAYMFGKISFLELLDRLEEILGIQSPQLNNKTSRKEDG